ncbi:MAG TPA: N-6 DNA methylase [Steroidobacteraceae bacterium]|nr:N-6 DNA methylase [Steroidobacteraceae bacterium]
MSSAALQLGAASVGGWSARERASAARSARLSRRLIASLRRRIAAGEDPLGEVFSRLRSRVQRRLLGATYTPPPIVAAMVAWARAQQTPERVVDPGAGSARFLVQAGAAFPRAALLGVEIDPLAAAIARANLAVAGYADRSRIVVADYREVTLRSAERTLFIGNPPYVRHHLIARKWKRWLATRATELGLTASGLAGLHVHFLLATALAARDGDCAAFVTSAEWLDINYGRLARQLFLGRLGGQALVIIEPTGVPFPDAATTAAISLFRIGSRSRGIRVSRVGQLGELNPCSGQTVARDRFSTETRWSRVTRAGRARPEGFVELGELCRVHRGQVTGSNGVWIAGAHSSELPRRMLFRCVTKARELFAAGRVLEDPSRLRFVVDLPEDLGQLAAAERRAVSRFLRAAKRAGAHATYIARHRRAWWSVGLRAPAPILATYMARRAPAFTRNTAGARHLNIAHGLYPREPLSEPQLLALVDFLATGISVADGRTYAYGLTKFEPREMERLWVPAPR